MENPFVKFKRNKAVEEPELPEDESLLEHRPTDLEEERRHIEIERLTHEALKNALNDAPTHYPLFRR